jgi:hypothetical protein
MFHGGGTEARKIVFYFSRENEPVFLVVNVYSLVKELLSFARAVSIYEDMHFTFTTFFSS